MAQKITIGNRVTSLPGVYTNFVSGINNPPLAASFGNVLLIDTGQGAGFVGGAGISGEGSSGKDAIYNFSRLRDFRRFARGGMPYLLGEPLFQPLGAGNAAGAPSVFVVKAATTTKASVTLTFTGGGTDGGTFVVNTRDEGTVANGVEDVNDNLTNGYSIVMRTSQADSAKFVLDFFVGTFTGLDADGEPYDGIAAVNTSPRLITSSVAFDNLQTLIDWATNDFAFNQAFELDGTSAVAGTGAVTATDLTANAGNNLFAGATETYDQTALEAVLDNITDLDYTFVLAQDYADDAQSADNSLILSHLVNEAKYRKYMIVGGGDDQSGFEGTNSSVETAQFYDSERVVVVHAGVKLRRRGGSGFKNRPSIYKAALVLGRIAGLAPQVPVTFKSLRMDGDRHEMNKIDQETALDNGVLVTVNDVDFGSYVVLQGVNSLQNNDFFVDDQGRSYEISIESIKAQLSKEIEINAKLELLGQSNGVNRNTLSPQDVAEWLKEFLELQTATETADNLITSSRNITVQTQGDTYLVSYSFQPSFPVNKLLFEGILLQEEVTI